MMREEAKLIKEMIKWLKMFWEKVMDYPQWKNRLEHTCMGDHRAQDQIEI